MGTDLVLQTLYMQSLKFWPFSDPEKLCLQKTASLFNYYLIICSIFFFKFKTHRHWPRTAEILHIKFEIPAFCKSWETVLAKTASLFTQLVNHLAEFDVTKPQARFPSKRNRLRCVRLDGNWAKRKRLRWQAANHGCHCFDRASYWLLLAFSPVSIQTQCTQC